MDWARILLLAVMVCLPLSVLAGPNIWTSIGPGGGSVSKVVYHTGEPSILYLIGDGGLYRSTNSGASWTLVEVSSSSPPTDLEIDPAHPDRFYIAQSGAGRLSVSNDAGVTVAPVQSWPNEFGNPSQIEVSHDGQILFASNGERLFKSADRAQSWQALGPFALSAISRLKIDPNDPNTLYAFGFISSSQMALLVTRNGGSSWQQVLSATPTSDYFLDIAVDPNMPGRLWVGRESSIWSTNDYGAHWTSHAVAAQSIAVDPSNSSIVYAGGWNGTVYRSQDAGGTWVNVSHQIRSNSIFHIAINPSRSSEVFVAGHSGVFRSIDSGASWLLRQSGLLCSRVDGFAINATTKRVYANGFGNAFVLDSSAASLQPLNNTALQTLEIEPNYTAIQAVHAQDGLQGHLFMSLRSGLARSDDGGDSWTLLPMQQGIGDLLVLTSAPAQPQVLLGGSFYGLHRSQDGGAQWSAVTQGLPANSFYQTVLFAPSDALIAYAVPQVNLLATQHVGVYRSNDAGVTWSAAANTGIEHARIEALAVAPNDARTVYALADSALMKSVDGGSNWTTLPWNPPQNGGSSFIAIDAAHPEILYVTSSDRIARSVNGGTDWELLRANATQFGFVTAMTVDPARPHVLLVGTQGHGAFEFAVEPDLSLQVDTPATQITTGSMTTQTYTATNTGPFSATDVKVVLRAASGATAVTASSSLGACTVAGTVITCDVGVLRVGASARITLTARLPDANTFDFAGSIQGREPDPVASNNAATQQIVVAAPTPVNNSGGGGGGALGLAFVLLQSLIALLRLRSASTAHRAKFL